MTDQNSVQNLSPTIRCLTAPNPSPMTANGTNSYIVGKRSHMVIDPGPIIDSHIDAILSLTDGEVSHILCTHTHPDHSPASKPLAEMTGAKVVGARAATVENQDQSFAPDLDLHHGGLISNGEVSLRALHTPGHVGNHYCFLSESDGVLFSGDHVMSGSTVVIIPPEGNMADYLSSLDLLADVAMSVIAPAHGGLIEDPHDEIARVKAHRLRREQKVVDALKRSRFDLDALVEIVYDDVPPQMHEWAKLSLTAHLLKLEQDGLASNDAEGWRGLS
ncbi:MAG: MBL fold metallo-hydrolase [Pseudomonadota bacterium]